jgi:hypothetical protein
MGIAVDGLGSVVSNSPQFVSFTSASGFQKKGRDLDYASASGTAKRPSKRRAKPRRWARQVCIFELGRGKFAVSMLT